MIYGRLLLCLFILLSGACSLPFVKVHEKEKSEAIIAQLSSYNQKIHQLKALVSIKATGIMGNFIHEQADIITQYPDRLFIALRSFFSSPAILIASNGEYLTIYDALNISGNSEVYQKIPLGANNSYFELFNFSFHPNILINLLQAKIPLENALNLQLAQSGDEVRVSGQGKDFFEFIVYFDLKLNQLKKTLIKNEELGILYELKYSDYVYIEGVSFPTRQLIRAKTKAKRASFDMKLSNILVNGEEILKDSFFIKPPSF